jgi:hypothetical protein
VLFSLLYLIFRLVVRVMPGDDRDREIELLVLRHQVKVLKRKASRPRLRRIDKAFLAACSRVLPKHRWGSFVVAPSTLLRWHRELVTRKWTYKAKSSGRPPVDSKLVALICRMAKDNSFWGYMRIKGECLKLGVRVSATTVKKVKGAFIPIGGLTSGFPHQGSLGSGGHGVPCGPTMFTKKVSGLVDGLDPHHGRGGAAGRANSKKDLLTGLIRVSVPFTLEEWCRWKMDGVEAVGP